MARFNIGDTLDSLIAKASAIAPNIKWAALGWITGLFTAWVV